MRPLTAGVASALLAATIACHGSSPVRSVSPSPIPAGHGVPVGLTLQGPAILAPGQTAQYTAIATMSDKSTQDYTSKATWSELSNAVVMVASNGQATGRVPGEAFIYATIVASVNIGAPSPFGSCCNATKPVMVLPANTYRLIGKVLESGLPVQGATITVVSGIGSGLSSTTDYAGSYRLYGVAGAVQIKMTKPGYVDLVKTFTASQNDVLDFPDARQTQTLPSLVGSYTLTLQADPACPTTPPNPHQNPLPEDMRQPRSYAVQMTQDGPGLHVTGAPPTFLSPSDHFEGRITPGGITFEFGNGYTGYGPDDALTAHLSSTQALSYEGEVTASRSGSAIVGRLNGDIQLFTMPTPLSEVGSCEAPNHAFSLTLAPAGTLR